MMLKIKCIPKVLLTNNFYELTKALGKICLLVYEDFSRNDGPEGIESLQEITIGELLR